MSFMVIIASAISYSKAEKSKKSWVDTKHATLCVIGELIIEVY